MREIKFRLIKNGEIVGYEWHRKNCVGEIDIFHSSDNDEWFNILFDSSSRYIKHDLKEQYTGLKDKNGVEIYEGDYLKIDFGVTFSPISPDFLGDVRFIESGFYVMNDKMQESFAVFQEIATWEIIGNIHENPELLVVE